MSIYTILIPDGTPNPSTVTVEGVSVIEDRYFAPGSSLCLWAIIADGSGIYSRKPAKLLDNIVAATVSSYPGSPSQWCKFRGVYTLPDGRNFPYDTGSYWNYFCGSTYFEACGVATPACDLLITNRQGAVVRVSGKPGYGCPSVIAIAGDCGPDQIKCDCPSDPRGFACISCSDLANKIRALI